MARLVELKGVDTVIRNLKKAGDTLGRGTARGLKSGGVFLERESRKIVPVQLGNLKASSFTRNIGGTGFRTDIIVGYTAEYAVYVHEDLEKAHGEAFNIKHAREIAAAAGTPRGTAKGGFFKRGKDQQAKFLEKPAREKRREILGIIHREANRG